MPRKQMATDRGQLRPFQEYRYLFWIANDRATPAREVVLPANDRCDQEYLISQWRPGVKALTTPVGDLVSSWASIVTGSLARSLKAWRPGEGA